jgi:hypothetical protein
MQKKYILRAFNFLKRLESVKYSDLPGHIEKFALENSVEIHDVNVMEIPKKDEDRSSELKQQIEEMKNVDSLDALEQLMHNALEDWDMDDRWDAFGIMLAQYITANKKF